DQAVPLLNRKLRPVPIPDPKHLAALFADLDNKQFAVREKATRALNEAGEAVVAEVRKAREGSKSLETNMRLERLLGKAEGKAWQVEWVRYVRALEILGHAGTPEAIKLLRRLAAGAPGARKTQEARAVLLHLESKQKRR